MDQHGARNRVVLSDLTPQVDGGRFAIKRIIGDEVVVEIDAFCDGHDSPTCLLLWKKEAEADWNKVPMEPIGNDRYRAAFQCETLGTYLYTVQGLVSKEWVTEDVEYSCVVEPRLAGFSAWYELFPRSCADTPNRHGTFQDVIKLLDEIAQMGFDVLYLPPIHPIGSSFRKGRNNSLQAEKEDHGSPWAIGSSDGGHKAIHPLLGTMDDFEQLVKEAKERDISLALDIAFQCSPDHPYLKEHPEWFKKGPDGKIKHAENPPKKYEDIVPFNFESDEIDALWSELLSIVLFWVERKVTVFRVDNPHTKSFIFWKWLIEEVKRKNPEVIFLSEAFTRPKVMHHLAKAGFSQSYTYFTWRYTKGEMTRFITELTGENVREYFRPNLWTNTPDILPIDLQYDSKAAFMIRLILAATLSSNYGIYGPPFERLLNAPLGESEEYRDAEKYEVKYWNANDEMPLKALMTKLNRIRRTNPALQKSANIRFYDTSSPTLLCFAKFASVSLFIVVAMNPFEAVSCTIKIPLDDLGIKRDSSYRMHELLEDRHIIHEGDELSVTIDPKVMPCRIYKIQTPMRREKGFEYFM